MITPRIRVVAGLLLPIVALVVLAVQKASIRYRGVEARFAIAGYDPRDLLSGHYLIYAIDFGVPTPCTSADDEGIERHLCLEPRAFLVPYNHSCDRYIVGRCRRGRFETGLERFFVPEDQAKELETKIGAAKAEILVSVSAGGRAVVKDLLIEGVTWRDAPPAPTE